MLIALLQVDTDGNDCDMIAEVLRRGYSPKIIHMEIATNFPPPLMFNWHKAKQNCTCCCTSNNDCKCV